MYICHATPAFKYNHMSKHIPCKALKFCLNFLTKTPQVASVQVGHFTRGMILNMVNPDLKKNI